ncbi:MAG: glycosyltransferase family 61 protein, partial [Blastochloris sp.]|nr:glycosyltransferase family 61 protein [Blastochloris sp.]
HNSALYSWLGYGHLLQDQMSKEAFFERQPLTQNLPLAANLGEHTYLRKIWKEQWKRPVLLIGDQITRFRRLHVLIQGHQATRRLQAEFMRHEFLSSNSAHSPLATTSRRRLYISRRLRRRVLNEAQIWSLLKDRGFEWMDDQKLSRMTLRQQAALFQSAEMIVSPHGSQLFNIFFCQSNLALIEFFKVSWPDSCALTILRASATQARYAYVMDWWPWETPGQTLSGADIRVDPDKLESLLSV